VGYFTAIFWGEASVGGIADVISWETFFFTISIVFEDGLVGFFN
jgi:hypothetical protein